jgi:carboxymethylenebutenolidase
VGFCWGGGMVNRLAVALGSELRAGVPFYGAAPDAADVTKIRDALLLHFADNDPRINALWPDYEVALKAAGVRYEAHRYPGTQHGFHNNSTPRYNPEQAKTAWERTLAWFKKYLA